MFSKKKFVSVLVLTTALAVTACGSAKENEPAADPTVNMSNEEKTDYYADHIVLGQYKGIEYTEGKAEVTEDDIKAKIDELVSSAVTEYEITDRAVVNGDIISLYFEGYTEDGVQFDGGTGTSESLTIGSGTMISGFEEQCIGKMPGEDFEIKVTFPEQYRPEGTAGSELNGQPATFKSKVNYIHGFNRPEYSDELVAEKTEYSTMAEYEESLKSEIASQK